jgi:hypothetical protein
VSLASLVTFAEQSGYVRTGRYDEVERLCRDFALADRRVRCVTLATTGQGRPIVALEIGRRELPAIYVQAGVHAGEIEGKDAGFWFVRDLLAGKVAPGALDAVKLIFVPAINPDGHERFGPAHRPNQRGPEQMGFRTNGARLNANRDFVKAETPEIHAALAAIVAHDPVLVIDLHCTDGAKFEHDISLNIAPIAPRGDGLERTAAALLAGLIARTTALGHLPLDFYPSLLDNDDPSSGFAGGEAPPRFSQFYAAARGRLGLLVETHSWRTYRERVIATYHTLQAVFEVAAREAAQWQRASAAADRADAALAGARVTLLWKTGPTKRTIAFRGYAYEKRTSDLTGGTWLVYDERTPQIWNVPFYDELLPAAEVVAPGAGYIVDGGFAAVVADKLKRHGLRYERISGELRREVEVFRVKKPTFAPPFEGRTRATFEGEWIKESRTLERGAIFVPIAQPHARLVMHLLEPSLPDSLAAWGFFNSALEQKEYMEPYVAEEQAREMLARDPSLRARFDAARAADAELAKSPAKQQDWFYRQHPSWDERVGLLPVFRAHQ